MCVYAFSSPLSRTHHHERRNTVEARKNSCDQTPQCQRIFISTSCFLASSICTLSFRQICQLSWHFCIPCYRRNDPGLGTRSSNMHFSKPRNCLLRLRCSCTTTTILIISSQPTHSPMEWALYCLCCTVSLIARRHQTARGLLIQIFVKSRTSIITVGQTGTIVFAIWWRDSERQTVHLS